MLKSTQALQNTVEKPLLDCYGPTIKILTVEAHDKEVRGLAMCPGKIVKYIYKIQDSELVTFDMLSLKRRVRKI
tara:strand:- start:339 stop:560 length:222 start_codon:yes stop_codon:yes gene_type:complete